MPKVDDLFRVVKGTGGYVRDYAPGTIPLVSATSLRNGVAAFVSGVPEFKAPAITVERITGTAFVQLVDFSVVPDDVSVLVPRHEHERDLDELYVIASYINNSRWRFSFARKLTPTRLRNMVIPDVSDKPFQLNQPYSILPEAKARKTLIAIGKPGFKEFQITKLFTVTRGDFHALSRLSPGRIPTVSRGAYDNGVVGYYAKPSKAKLYPALTITVSTVTGDAFVQLQPFIATDNVLVLLPNIRYTPATLFFVTIMLNREKWRCTYGRQLYRAKFEKTQISLPVDGNGELDESYIDLIIESCPYWQFLESSWSLSE